MPKETDFLEQKLTLVEFGIQLMASELLQNNSQMLSMLFFAARVHQDVIDEDNNKLIQLFHENLVYHTHEVGLVNPKDITVNSYWP